MILVTGGTGLVGSHLLYALAKEGHRLRATHRKESSLTAVKQVFDYYPDGGDLFKQIEWYEANILDISKLKEAFDGVTIVYHCAAYISFDPKKYHLLRKTNITGTANVVNLALQHNIDKLCYVSTIAILGPSKIGGIINEDCDWDPEEKNSVYGISKYGAEMEVWRGSQEGLNTVIVNPGVILGEGHWDSASGSVITSAYKGIPFITKGSMGVVDVKDVVRAMIQLTKSAELNKRFVLVGHNGTYSDLFGLISTALGKKPPKRFIGKFWLLSLSKIEWFFSSLFRTKRTFVSAFVESLFKNDTYDSSLLKNTLDFKFTPVQQTIKRVCDCYINDRS
ncbi:MAG: NAD-dependent epimerase/dehydratase family protein [Gilvibacter sp.]